MSHPELLSSLSKLFSDIDPHDQAWTVVFDAMVKVRKLAKVAADAVPANQLPLELPQ